MEDRNQIRQNFLRVQHPALPSVIASHLADTSCIIVYMLVADCV